VKRTGPPTIDEVGAARRAVHDTCLRMVADGLVVGSAGNVSLRVGEHHAVVTAGGVPYDKLVPDDHPVVDARDGAWDGGWDGRAPTSEIALHTGILRARPEVMAIVHTHSRHAAAFSVARIDLPFVCNENIGPRAERILVTAPYAPPGSVDLGLATLATLDRQPGSRACLLANHGVVAVADDLDTAYMIAAQVEWAAEVTYLARTLGGEHVLTPEQQDAIGRNYRFTIAREGFTL
jgi:L-fuculose-phosphate aldolase